MDINGLCMGCMREVEDIAQPCPHCGYLADKTPDNGHFLLPYTILNGRYLVGRVMQEEESRITYIGYELNLQIRVMIEEFYPKDAVERNGSEGRNKEMVSVRREEDADQVQKEKEEFLAQAKALAKNGGVQIKNFFEENGTVYIVTDYREEMSVHRRPPVSKKWIAAAGCFFVVVCIAIVFLLSGRDAGDEQPTAAITDEVSEEPLYFIEQPETIDLLGIEHEPGTKVRGMQWDSTLFYWLEDIDTSSPEDGNIARCQITRRRMKNASNANTIEYEIYSDAQTGEIYKIVGIEQQGSTLLLTDYYYQNGKVNFIFLRYDSVYTPTYATGKKIGERFYFCDDVMVRWRSVAVPEQIEECTLHMRDDVTHMQTDYFAQTEQDRQRYDELESSLLNEAYHVYEAVSAEPGIGVLEGTVHDASGSPVADRDVNIYRQQDDVLLYRTKTQSDGSFSAYVYLDNTKCYMEIGGEGEYQDIRADGLYFTDSSLDYSYPDLVLRTGEEVYPVQLAFYDAEEVETSLKDVSVTFSREGSAISSDEAAETKFLSDAYGMINEQLPGGTYMVTVQKEGYLQTNWEISVSERTKSRKEYLVPELSGGQSAVVLTWNDESLDLDLAVFTPYQAENGNMAHIGRQMQSDAYGNRIVAVPGSGCETAYIDTAVLGSYKIYAVDYTDGTQQNYTADAMAGADARIQIYDSKGLLETFAVPTGEQGVIWEAAQISGSRVSASQRVYSDIDGEDWWMASELTGSESLLDAFLANLTPAFTGDGSACIWVDDLRMNEGEWESYSVGERIDLDNDGENELILNGPYGGMYLDAGVRVEVLAEGDGTADQLSYVHYDDAVWIVHSDTMHMGRKYYHFTKYEGGGNIVDEFTLSAEYWDSVDDRYDENSDFTYRDQKITMEEYEAMLEEIFKEERNGR